MSKKAEFSAFSFMEKREPFSIMIKPIGSTCNLACTYCYYRNKEYMKEAMSNKMSDELLELFIKQYFEAHPGPIVSFVWHGGEPTLAGLNFYKKAVQYQKKYLPEGYQCWNNLQTNGTLLNDEWCAFLAENHFDIGLSIDGTELLHDLNRKDILGRNTYQTVVNHCKLLQKHGIQPDLLCTVTKETAKYPLEVYEALKSLHTGWMQFIPIVNFDAEGNLKPESVSAKAYGEFLCTIFDKWYPNDLRTTGIQIVAESIMKLSGYDPSLCILSKRCGQALVVEHDGGVYSCDHFVYPEYCLGNITENHLGNMAYSDIQKAFGDQKEYLPEKCMNCSSLFLCTGGCIKNRKKNSEDDIPLNVLCEGYKMFFEHIKEPLLKMVRRK